MLGYKILRPSAALRPLASLARTTTTTTTTTTSSFHTTRPALVPVRPGDALPDTDALMEGTPGTRVNLAREADRVNNMLLIGVPAAFSPACSARHVPGYAQHPRTREFDLVGVVSVNDVFV